MNENLSSALKIKHTYTMFVLLKEIKIISKELSTLKKLSCFSIQTYTDISSPENVP